MDDEVASARPRAADIAFALTLIAAAVVLVVAALVPTQIAPTIARSRDQAKAQEVDLAALEHGLVMLSVVIVVVAAVVAALLVLLAFRVRRGRSRSRIGIVIVTILLVASLDLQLLLAALVLAVADVLFFSPPVARWLRATAPMGALPRR